MAKWTTRINNIGEKKRNIGKKYQITKGSDGGYQFVNGNLIKHRSNLIFGFRIYDYYNGFLSINGNKEKIHRQAHGKDHH